MTTPSHYLAAAVAALFALTCGAAVARPGRYVAGQVWEYRTRPGDVGSLLKIQRLETDPSLTAHGAIYHISIIGLHMRNGNLAGALQHAPVSEHTLDVSVVRLSHSKADFPSPNAGIEEWKRARGGVFTISVAEIVEFVDKLTAEAR